jgi:salicylate hydroxylase
MEATTSPSPAVAIIGAGIAGMSAAIALRRSGIEALLFEQTPKFARIGAAINLTPNAVKVLDRLNIGASLRARASQPLYRLSRVWNTGEETSRLELGDAGLERYGAPQLMVHRADLLAALENALPADAVKLGKQLIGLDRSGASVVLHFADGTETSASAVIGADGIHSKVRECIFGDDLPHYTGMVAYRDIVPSDRVPHYDRSGFTKWWGPTFESQLVTFPIDCGREIFVFATKAEKDSGRESWSREAEISDLRTSFADYHEAARGILAACEQPLKTPLFHRDPMRAWAEGKVALIGDACHAMLPFMAQGAAMGLEDAAVLARCIVAANADWAMAFARYQRNRIPRATEIQFGSGQNEWLKRGGVADAVYSYDAWQVALD